MKEGRKEGKREEYIFINHYSRRLRTYEAIQLRTDQTVQSNIITKRSNNNTKNKGIHCVIYLHLLLFDTLRNNLFVEQIEIDVSNTTTKEDRTPIIQLN